MTRQTLIEYLIEQKESMQNPRERIRASEENAFARKIADAVLTGAIAVASCQTNAAVCNDIPEVELRDKYSKELLAVLCRKCAEDTAALACERIQVVPTLYVERKSDV